MDSEVHILYSKFKDYNLCEKSASISFEDFTNFIARDKPFNNIANLFFKEFNLKYNQNEEMVYTNFNSYLIHIMFG